MIRAFAVPAAAVLFGLLVPSASAAPVQVSSRNLNHPPMENFSITRPPACTSPAVVNDGLIEVRCFPVIPAKQFPRAGQKCSHVDAWTTGHSIQVVNGHTYRITQKVRDDVWICRS